MCVTSPNIRPFAVTRKLFELHDISCCFHKYNMFVSSCFAFAVLTQKLGIHKFLCYTNDNRISVSLLCYVIIIIIIVIIMTTLISFSCSFIKLNFMMKYLTDVLSYFLSLNSTLRLQQQMPMLIDPVILCIF